MSLVLFQEDSNVVFLSLNRPEKKNAVNGELLGELETAVDRCRDSAKAVILKGEGGCFCAGADIRDLSSFDETGLKRFHDLRERVFAKLEDLPCPLVAVIHGYALGTGLELALCADFRIASEEASLGIPSSKLGVAESYLYLDRLVRSVGLARAKYLVLTGERVGALEAREFGLVEKVYPEAELWERAKALGGELAHNAAFAMRLSKKILTECDRDPYVRNVEEPARPMIETMTKGEMREGTRAFVEKREAKFDG